MAWLADNYRPWARRVIVVGVLVASAYYAPRASLSLVLLIPAALIVSTLSRHPVFGLLALVPVSLLVPFSMGTGTQTSLPANVLLLGLLLALWLGTLAHRWLRHAPFTLVISRPMWPLLALCGVATVSLIAGTQSWLVFARTAPLASQLGGLAIFALSTGAFILTPQWIRQERWLRYLTWLFLALGSVYIVGRLTPGIGGRLLRSFQDGSIGSLFWVWLVTLSFSQAVFNRDLALPKRGLLMILTLATLYVGWFQGESWASGWAPPLVTLLLILWIRSRWVGLTITLFGMAMILWRASGLVDAVLASEDYSIITRDLARQILLTEALPLSPLIGLGPSNYYWYTPHFSLLGYHVQFNSHNNYVDILMQTGLLGLICFAWFVVEFTRLGWRLRLKVSGGFQQAYVYGALAGLGGTLVAAWLGDWFLPFVYNIGFAGLRASILAWIFLGGLLALEAGASICHKTTCALGVDEKGQ